MATGTGTTPAGADDVAAVDVVAVGTEAEGGGGTIAEVPGRCAWMAAWIRSSMAGMLAVMAAWTALVISVLSATRPWVVAGPALDVGTLLAGVAVDAVSVVGVVAGPEDAIVLCRSFVKAFPGPGASLPAVFCCHVAAMTGHTSQAPSSQLHSVNNV